MSIVPRSFPPCNPALQSHNEASAAVADFRRALAESRRILRDRERDLFRLAAQGETILDDGRGGLVEIVPAIRLRQVPKE